MAVPLANLSFDQFVDAVEQEVAGLHAAGSFIDLALYSTPDAVASECDFHATQLVAARASVSTLDDGCRVIGARIRDPQTTKRQIRKLKPIYRSLDPPATASQYVFGSLAHQAGLTCYSEDHASV